MGIRDWPEDARPREKLLKRGAAALTDAELVAVFLRTGVVGKSAVDLGRELIERFGGLGGLCRADKKAACDAPGVGEAKYALLQAVMEMARRTLVEDMQASDALSSPLPFATICGCCCVARNMKRSAASTLTRRIG